MELMSRRTVIDPSSLSREQLFELATGIADNQTEKDAQDAEPKDKREPAAQAQGPTLTKKQKKQLQAM